MSELVALALSSVFYLLVASVPILLIVWIAQRARRVGAGKSRQTRSLSPFYMTMRAARAQQVSGGFLVEHGGIAYRFRHIYNSEGPDTIQVDRTIPERSTADALPELPVMRLREENRRDRLGKRLHINHELQTGDALFDEHIYIECDGRDHISHRMLSSPEVREGVTGLLALGFQFVDFRSQRCDLKAEWHQGAAEFDLHTVEQTVSCLAQIADNLPAFRRVPSSSPMTTGSWVVLTSWLLAGVSLMMHWMADARWEPLGSGLDPLTVRAGSLLLLLHIVAVWATVRGHSRALRHLTSGVLAGVLLAPCASRALLTTANGAGDTTISTHERVLSYRRMDVGEDSTSYFFFFPAVPGMVEDSLQLSVSRQEFNAASQGDTFQLMIGAGRLGTPWLLDLEPLNIGR